MNQHPAGHHAQPPPHALQHRAPVLRERAGPADGPPPATRTSKLFVLTALQLRDYHVNSSITWDLVGIDADLTGHLERLGDDVARRQLAVLRQGSSRRLCESAARADGHNAVFGLQHVTVAGENERHFDRRPQASPRGGGECGLPPVLRKLYGGPGEVSLMLLVCLRTAQTM